MKNKEYDDIIKMITFIKIQNAVILQLLLDESNGYKKNAYKKVHKMIIKEWERVVEDYLDVDPYVLEESED